MTRNMGMVVLRNIYFTVGSYMAGTKPPFTASHVLVSLSDI